MHGSSIRPSAFIWSTTIGTHKDIPEYSRGPTNLGLTMSLVRARLAMFFKKFHLVVVLTRMEILRRFHVRKVRPSKAFR